jgi:ATP-dependent RNA helicase DeaD
MNQSQRTRVMEGFKSARIPILVATDVAARGIDVFDVEAVINYDLPNENEYYLHRIGRTGRAKRHGVAFSLMSFADSVRMDEILKYMKTVPTMLHFDDMGILRDEDEQAFFENI